MTTRDDLLGRVYGQSAQVDSLLTRPLNSCSATWAKTMCQRFDLADGYATDLQAAREAIAAVRDEVGDQ